MRLLAAVLLTAGLLVGALASAAPAQRGGNLLEIVEIDGVLDRTVASYATEVIEDANARGAEAIVVQLDALGAIGDAGARVVEAIRGSRVPVVVWVGPGGARATGAGMHIAYAGHLLAVAPGTVLGAGSPGDLTADEAAQRAADEALLTKLAALRGRDLDIARAAVDGLVVAAAPEGAPTELPADAALPDGIAHADVVVLAEAELSDRGIVDFLAATLPDVLRELDGREVVLADGTARLLEVDTVTATVRFNNLGILRQLLHAVASPTLAYLLVLGGALALVFELFQPGFGVAGLSGLILIGFGLYGFLVLPVSWLAFAVVVAGLALLAADLALGRLGILTVAGTAALAGGSALLFTGPAVLRVPAWVIGIVVVACVVYFVGVLTTVLRAQGNQAMAGAEQVIGQTGVVRSMLNPEGHIFAGGALWRARAPEDAGKVRTGTVVRVVGLNDSLTLDVTPVDVPHPEAPTTV